MCSVLSAASAIVLALCLSLATVFAQAPPTTAGHAVVSPSDVSWKTLRPGAEIAVISGEPSKDGAPFVIRMRYHGKARIPPHWHPVDEHLTVLSGTFRIGMGESGDPKATTALSTGAYVLMPAKMPHYAWTDGDALIQVHGIGPFSINYVNPADDPAKATQK